MVKPRRAAARARPRVLLAVAAVVAATDLLTKAAAVALSGQMPLHLPGGWSLRVAHNYGLMFGIGAGTIAPVVVAALSVVNTAWLLCAGRYLHGHLARLWAVAVGLTLGAAIGNLGEQRVFGSSVDWIRPPHLNVVFNLADVAAVAGQVLLLALLVPFVVTLSRGRAPGGMAAAPAQAGR